MVVAGLIICWVIAALIIAADPKMESNRWYSAAAFVCGFFWIGLLIKNNPVFFEKLFSPKVADIFEGFCYASIHYFLPYCSLMYAFSYTGIFARWKTRIAFILLIPVLIMYFFFPVQVFCYPHRKEFTTTINTLFFWLVPYLFGAILLLLVSYFKAKNRLEKLDRMLICISVIPCILIVLFIEFLYGFYSLHLDNAAKILMISGIFEFVVILFGIISFGIFGVKLQVEKNRLSGTIQSMTFGTAFLNHIIKNEILKVAMCTENIKPYLRNNASVIGDCVTVLSNSTQRMLSMIERIQKQMGEIKIKISPHNIIAIIEESLFALKPLLEAKNILVHKNYDGEVIAPCDSFHIQEVFTNLFKNAIEAMETGGELSIEMNQFNKRVVFAIKDTGSGIDKENLHLVMEPFFTTKNRRNNFGLGLSYCYNVMQQHGGTLEIFSKKGEGTTVFLHFAIKTGKFHRRSRKNASGV